MNHLLVELLSYSIAIAAIIGLININRIDKNFYLFITLLWIGLANEITSSILIAYSKPNAFNSNIYVLTEALLVTWFFQRLGLFTRNRKIFYLILLIFSLSWGWENFISGSIFRFGSYFRIFYSFVIVLMSINLLNRLIYEEKKKLVNNPVFLILIGFIIFFTYKALVEIFWVYGLNSSKEFRVAVYRIMTYINFSVNLIYAIALVWTPRKREYTLL